MIKRRKKPTDHREGKLIRLVDAIQELVKCQYDKELITSFDNDNTPRYNPRSIEKIISIMREIRKFDITTIGDLYLTPGGRVVLDSGYGEYFTGGDKKIYTLKELMRGISYNTFLSRIKEVNDEKR